MIKKPMPPARQYAASRALADAIAVTLLALVLILALCGVLTVWELP